MVNNKIEVGKSSFTWSIHLRAVRVVSYTVWSTLHILSAFFGRCVEGGDGRGPLVGMDWWPPFGKSSSSCEFCQVLVEKWFLLKLFWKEMVLMTSDEYLNIGTCSADIRFLVKWFASSGSEEAGLPMACSGYRVLQELTVWVAGVFFLEICLFCLIILSFLTSAEKGAPAISKLCWGSL